MVPGIRGLLVYKQGDQMSLTESRPKCRPDVKMSKNFYHGKIAQKFGPFLQSPKNYHKTVNIYIYRRKFAQSGHPVFLGFEVRLSNQFFISSLVVSQEA
jgi:hypothetical protein